MNSQEVLSSGNAIFYRPKKFTVYINCDKSCCNKLYQNSELSQGLKKSKPESKNLQKLQHSQQSFQKNLQESFTASIPSHQETVFSRSYWESLPAESHETKSGKLQLPSRWVDLFTNTLRDLNQYCNLNFTRHDVYVKGGRLMRADFYCNIEECQLQT